LLLIRSIFGHQLAPTGINVWNPSFDVTPSSLINGVITELGVCVPTKAGAMLDVPAFVQRHAASQAELTERVRQQLIAKLTKVVVPTDASIGFKRMTETDIAQYIITDVPGVHSILGIDGKSSTTDLTVTEVGDGNLNFVYIIKSMTAAGAGRAVVAKQALPYVRCVGESWPLTLERAVFEQQALTIEKKLSPQYVPQVYHFDRKLYLMGTKIFVMICVKLFLTTFVLCSDGVHCPASPDSAQILHIRRQGDHFCCSLGSVLRTNFVRNISSCVVWS
jgi:hypothetical protein